MKSMNKFVASIGVAATLFFGVTPSAFAATQQDITSELQQANVNETYITKVDNFLKANTLTPAQLDQINAQVKVGTDVLKANNTNDVSKLSQTDKSTLMNAITGAAKAANLNVSFGKDANGNAVAILTDAAGNEVFRATTGDAALKVTGSDLPMMLYGGAFLMLVGAVLLVTRKKIAA